MTYYRVYVLDSTGAVVRHADLSCGSDQEALFVAESLLEPGMSAEVLAGPKRLSLAAEDAPSEPPPWVH